MLQIYVELQGWTGPEAGRILYIFFPTILAYAPLPSLGCSLLLNFVSSSAWGLVLCSVHTDGASLLIYYY